MNIRFLLKTSRKFDLAVKKKQWKKNQKRQNQKIKKKRKKDTTNKSEERLRK